ncbi:sensor histidine kinase [Bdellovibrio sp. HCB337]|uniref:sensor histidine kinase n=1 Tax=Bdellovibrio sp. HCB337 TaxID=3394358 RepID=UPI0039A6AB9E
MSKPQSISKQTLLQMAVRIAIVIFVVTLISYFHVMKTTEVKVKENVQQFISERASREKVPFKEAGDNHAVIISEFLKHYQKYSNSPLVDQQFAALTEKNTSGTIRNRNEGFNGKQDSGIFISPKGTVSREFKARILAAYEVTNRFGLPYRHQFQDLYFTFPENAIVLYWPEFPNWVMDAKDDFDLTVEEYYTVSTPNKDPDRKTAWTGLFYDKVSAVWMVTASTPIYVNNKFLGSVHHDLMVNEILDRTIKQRLSGANNYYIVRTDGRLIFHPNHYNTIKEHAGQFDIQKSNDETLKAQFEVVKQVKNEIELVDSPDGKDSLAVAKIDGPDWYLVTSYPYSAIRSAAAKNALFVLFAGLFSLLVEVCVLFFVLKNQISAPLRQLIEATRKIASDRTFTKIDLKRTDELGQLASSFNEMTAAIQERDEKLAQHSHNLEILVGQRTKELDEQKAINLQASKMSALGEMAGGIAHEINTPLATIKILTSQLVHETLSDIPDLDNLTTQLQRIESTTDRVAKIVKGLKTFARDGNSDPFEACKVQNIVEETVILCSEQLRMHGIELKMNIAPEISLECRSIQISQVLLNLIGNASDAIENLESKWVEIQARNENSWIEIRVTDSGSGIDKATEEKIFQPFYTTKGIGKGTGMGLSISLGIVKAHGGQLSIDHKSPHTCFIIRLPTNQRKAA